VPVVAAADGSAGELLGPLRDALSGAGPALLPHPPGRRPGAVPAAGAELAPGEDDEADPTVLAIATSGSTGSARIVLLQASALLASVAATHDRLGGPGHWLLALPAEHVAGAQVLLRSLVARTTPVALDLSGGFDPGRFAAAAARVPGARRYTALVPTQLVRLLAAGGEPLAALAGFDAVLVGGAATPPELARRAAAAGVRLVRTYGMTETAGGCVYDGVPLDGVGVALGADGRIELTGPVLARRYLGGEPIAPLLRTDDAGRLDDGVLTVLGRADDVIVTGGVNVAPGPVEEALLGLPGVAEAAVVGVPDPEWGRRVAAALVLEPGAAAPGPDAVREHVAGLLGREAVPRQVTVLDALPLRGPGKPDRTALAALLQQHEGP
jgi:O-succinylbenzoic acid--CoA ligase